MTRHYLSAYRDFPMPRLRDDAEYGAYLVQARAELESNRYAFDTKDGREFESGREVSRYSRASDYNPAGYATRESIYDCIFARAIKSRAARLFNRANQ